MKCFYVIDRNGEIYKIGIAPDPLELAMHCTARIFISDVREWLNNAKHGDSFTLDASPWKLVCLDTKEFGL